MAKAPKSKASGKAPPIVSTLPPPEPVQAKRKRALPDDIPRGSLPAPKRKAKAPVKPARKAPAWKPDLGKQVELEAAKLGTPASPASEEWDADAAFAEARASFLAKQAAKHKAPVAPSGAIVVPGARRARKPRGEAEHVERKLEPMPHGGALKRSTLEKPDPREAAPKKAPRSERKPRVPMTEDLYRLICGEMAEDHTPLAQICRRDDRPSKSEFFRYKDGDDLDPDDPASPDVRSARLARYARARKDWLDGIVEESIEIADDATNDWVEREMESGRIDVALDRDHVQRSKLRIDTRLKLAALLDPVRYGNLLKLGDPNAKPMDTGGKSASDLAIGMAKLLAAAQRETQTAGE